jgi:glycosyltransferase involved in cell wall biosynthesis
MVRSAAPAKSSRREPEPLRPIRVGFVLHVMQVAGAEVLVAETIRRLGKRVDPVIFCLDAVGALGERMIAEGCPVVAFGRRQGLDLGLPRRMSRVIAARRLDVLHAHQYTPFFYGAIAGRLSGISPRVIFTEHGRHYPDVVSLRRRLINRFLLDRLADDVNAVCEFSARSLADKDGFRASRIEIIPNGIDFLRYAPTADSRALRMRLGLSPARRYIACVARFHPVKDHRTLLKAFSIVAGARADVDLLLVGDGPLRPQLELQTQELGIIDRVQFMGIRQDIPDILRAVDVFTLTSVSEAASITLLEAMAAERPVVVTGVGGNPELVRHGQEGLLAPRADAGAIASAFVRILDDPALALALGTAGAARVRAHFLLDQTIERYYQLYRRAHPMASSE